LGDPLRVSLKAPGYHNNVVLRGLREGLAVSFNLTCLIPEEYLYEAREKKRIAPECKGNLSRQINHALDLIIYLL